MEKGVETLKISLKTPTISTDPQKINSNIGTIGEFFRLWHRGNIMESNRQINWAGWPDLSAPGESFQVVLPRFFRNRRWIAALYLNDSISLNLMKLLSCPFVLPFVLFVCQLFGFDDICVRNWTQWQGREGRWLRHRTRSKLRQSVCQA